MPSSIQLTITTNSCLIPVTSEMWGTLISSTIMNIMLCINKFWLHWTCCKDVVTNQTRRFLGDIIRWIKHRKIWVWLKNRTETALTALAVVCIVFCFFLLLSLKTIPYPLPVWQYGTVCLSQSDQLGLLLVLSANWKPVCSTFHFHLLLSFINIVMPSHSVFVAGWALN